MPLVRHAGRGGRPVLHLGVPPLPDRGDHAVRLRRAGPGGERHDRHVRPGRTAVRRAERRPGVHLHRGHLLPGELRGPGGGRLLLGRPGRGRQRGPVRLAQGQVRPVLADRPHSSDRAARGPRPAEVAAGHACDAHDEEDRDQLRWQPPPRGSTTPIRSDATDERSRRSHRPGSPIGGCRADPRAPYARP